MQELVRFSTEFEDIIVSAYDTGDTARIEALQALEAGVARQCMSLRRLTLLIQDFTEEERCVLAADAFRSRKGCRDTLRNAAKDLGIERTEAPMSPFVPDDFP